eukprot:GEMP01053589.1.p1 GENE.GEMP01053589.1~~GEMP01053589.1.p1  ORF type:complete len:119 (-),score=3.00 GEMP01053589.1:130-486(-)
MYAQQKRNCHYITNHTTQAGQFFLRFLKTQKRAVCGTQKKNTKVFTTNNNLLILNVRGNLFGVTNLYCERQTSQVCVPNACCCDLFRRQSCTFVLPSLHFVFVYATIRSKVGLRSSDR